CSRRPSWCSPPATATPICSPSSCSAWPRAPPPGAAPTGSPPPGPSSRPLAAARCAAGIAWAIVLVTLALWELSAFLIGVATPPGTPTPPSVSGALDPYFADFTSRAVLVALWVAGGAYLLHRAMLAGRPERR